ncbi:hypothetical protein QRD02_11255 [Aequorivita sp. SDUM287046]|uniref:Lipocalin-like domain-containing protein n=1 Tax=Aequorivita aurantiaca TaxID=3053356 RepID=A0ABT8DIX1_9FLAO|nr:hypothetical protein [Aequorivita aurantiaca]MDN3724963.1 hypothetical protein [Aequorivita aurantiaca]
MIPFKALPAIFLLLAITSFLSCNNDEKEKNTVPTNNLLGIWQRSDVSEMYDFKLYFNTENEGYITEYIANPDSTAISNLRPFTWHTSENTLTLDYDDGENDTTPFSINADGQLFVPGLSGLQFNKL